MACYSYFILLHPDDHEIHIAYLNAIGVDSFIEHEDAIEAFVEVKEEAILISEIESYLLENELQFEKRSHEMKDWNQEWESNFKAYSISKRLIVRAPFHAKDDSYETQVIIYPKMAFGTGHHETTSMILEWMTNQTFNNLKILDFGCGTGILGIYAAKKGARNICFIDNDPLSIENANENIRLNDITNATCILGTQQSIPDEFYDIIFANITRNVLLDSMDALSAHLSDIGILVLSGFLVTDCDSMFSNNNFKNLKLLEQKQKGEWMCITAEKK